MSASTYPFGTTSMGTDRIDGSSLGTTIIKAAYGLDVSEKNDKYISTFEEGVKSIELIGTGAILEHFPFLTRIPTWLPGTHLIKEVKYARELTSAFVNVPWNDALKRVVGQNR